MLCTVSAESVTSKSSDLQGQCLYDGGAREKPTYQLLEFHGGSQIGQNRGFERNKCYRCQKHLALLFCYLRIRGQVQRVQRSPHFFRPVAMHIHATLTSCKLQHVVKTCWMLS